MLGREVDLKNDAKRKQCKEIHIPRIPQAKIFMNGKVIVLNAD